MNIGIVGAGIIGLATAYKAQLKYPESKVIIFEKENEIGLHQSSRNSGVLHSGLYYKPGSLKARLAVDGIKQMTEFCVKNNIPHEICGKIVSASDSTELNRLHDLAERGKQNGLEGLRLLNKKEVLKRESNVNSVQALLVPQEGIVDYKSVMKKLLEKILMKDGVIEYKSIINGIEEKKDKTILSTNKGDFEFDLLIFCTGLFSDRVYERVTKKKSPIKIVPFRGDYFKLNDESRGIVNHLIYPVPDPKYPFLGVHFTRLFNGNREVGPNAVLAFKREGYKFSDFSLKDTFDSLSYSGMRKFIYNNFRFSLNEFSSSILKSSFLSKAKKIIPSIKAENLERGTSGVRAQAVDKSGNLVMDFVVERYGHSIFLLNAPSPGATASLAIADYILN